MKKIIILILVACFIVFNYINSNNFRIVNEYKTPSNNIVVEFNDGSSYVINKKNNLYEFYPAELGDWSITANNKKELENIIKTYMEYKYNIDDSFHIED